MAVAFASCEKSKNDTAKANIEKHIKENMDNPKSYEFVAMDSLKNITEVDSLFKKQQQLMKNVDRENMVKKSLKDLVVSELYLLSDGISIDMKKHNENKKELDRMEQSIEKDFVQIDNISKVFDDSLQTSKLKKNVIGYKTIFTYRGTNENGAIVVMKKNVELDKKLKPIG